MDFLISSHFRWSSVACASTKAEKSAARSAAVGSGTPSYSRRRRSSASCCASASTSNASRIVACIVPGAEWYATSVGPPRPGRSATLARFMSWICRIASSHSASSFADSAFSSSVSACHLLSTAARYGRAASSGTCSFSPHSPTAWTGSSAFSSSSAARTSVTSAQRSACAAAISESPPGAAVVAAVSSSSPSPKSSLGASAGGGTASTMRRVATTHSSGSARPSARQIRRMEATSPRLWYSWIKIWFTTDRGSTVGVSGSGGFLFSARSFFRVHQGSFLATQGAGGSCDRNFVSYMKSVPGGNLFCSTIINAIMRS
mmetsp:Transcript_26675/g.80528  ORF Transcript_26675/g.80528 Transcript_26675/m.80528 type:complete len:317 (+) Transcript_26675:212-1162(+)